MKTLNDLLLKVNEKKALNEFKMLLLTAYPGAEIILYGSKARGDSAEESDIDLLVVLPQKVTSAIDHELSVLKFNIELHYDVIIGMIVESDDFWRSPRVVITPLHINIEREGAIV